VIIFFGGENVFANSKSYCDEKTLFALQKTFLSEYLLKKFIQNLSLFILFISDFFASVKSVFKCAVKMHNRKNSYSTENIKTKRENL